MIFKSLLRDFDEALLADCIKNDLEVKASGEKGVNYSGSFTYVVDLSRKYDDLGVKYDFNDEVQWNSYHVELAFVKALKNLSARGVIEFVSLRKTRLAYGFVHTASERRYSISLSDKVVSRVAGIIAPVRWLKATGW